MNDKTKSYDLLMILPEIKSEDERIKIVRSNLVNYLLAMQAEFINLNKIQPVETRGWVDGFDPSHYEIPTKNLPPHPLYKNA